ncbi:hypothetical protein [Streptomyces sp. TRM75561]|uniref:beta barrel domain-containing protein n=1 Tax=Streptomyces sp. TRM75561 TaxID=2975269 RepID=UPI00244706FE|nr:hypothetical protein [Streptomyces sp. TRM75561]MDH3037944.1 hypothetical protein [Streptomyces sp. TRM75561]
MSTTGLPNVKVGDPLILSTSNRYRSDEPVTVSRVGRKYLYVARQDGREVLNRYHRDTGYLVSSYSVSERLYTQEQYDEMKQRASLLEQLRQAGIDVRHEVRSGVTTEQLRALLAVMTTAA